MQIKVRQFVLPNGHQELRNVEIPDMFAILYCEMQQARCELQAEVLTTGEVSVTVTDAYEDLDIRLVDGRLEDDPNEGWPGERSEVRAALCQLLQNASWRKR